jgi:hypothetical protein
VEVAPERPAAIVALPLDTAVTRPDALTVATAAFEEDQFT